MIKAVVSGISLLVLLLSMTGCVAKAPKASFNTDKEFQKLLKEERSAVVYFQRESTVLMAAGVELNIYVDDTHIGNIGNQNAYYAVFLQPGKHTYTFRAKNAFGDLGVMTQRFLDIENNEKIIFKGELIDFNDMEPRKYNPSDSNNAVFLGYKKINNTSPIAKEASDVKPAVNIGEAASKKPQEESSDIEQELVKLKKLYDKGLIDKEEYKSEKKELLKQL